MDQSHFSVKMTVPPAQEPVSLDQMKRWLRVDFADDDDKITDLISTARSLVESWTWRPCLPATYLVCYDRFPLIPNTQYAPGNPNTAAPVLQNTWPLDPTAWALLMPRSPVIAGSVVISYLPSVGADMMTMDPSGYIVDVNSEPARLATAGGSYWPAVVYQANSVQVTFQAGYPTAEDVPPEMRTAIRMLVARLYDDPNALASFNDNGAPTAIDALLESVRVRYTY